MKLHPGSPRIQALNSRGRQLLKAGGIDVENVAHHVLTGRDVLELDTDGLVLERYGALFYVHDPSIAAAAGDVRGPLLRADVPLVSGEPVLRSEFSVHREDGRLAWFGEPCDAYDTRARMFLHVFPVDPNDLPADRKRYGFEYLDFFFSDYGAVYGGARCLAFVPLPDYPIARIATGRYGGRGVTGGIAESSGRSGAPDRTGGDGRRLADDG